MQLIADILSFKDNRDQLASHIQKTSINWDALVVIGSKHLMLPAIYCRLKAKNLLNLLPEDLSLYLEEITSINRGRNEILLQEAHEISELFNKENIDHVFIKGIALLGGHVFEDPAERMIGDMDILVAENELRTAFDLLIKHGYTDTISSNFVRKKFRHLPRQVSPQKFGAVELHSEILIHEFKNLINLELVLKNKQKVQGISIPTIEDSIKIAILALQVNDNAYSKVFLSFKTIYDCLALNLNSHPILKKRLSLQKHSHSFLLISSVFFKDLLPSEKNYKSPYLRYFLFKINNPIFGRFISIIVGTSIKTNIRVRLLIQNKSYRRNIIKNKLGLRIK